MKWYKRDLNLNKRHHAYYEKDEFLFSFDMEHQKATDQCECNCYRSHSYLSFAVFVDMKSFLLIPLVLNTVSAIFL